MIRHLDIIGNNYPADTRIVLIHPEEIAATIAAEIQQPFTEKNIRYIYSDDRTAAEVARVLGAAIDKPGLPWVPFEDEQALQELVENGMSAEMGHRFVELGIALRTRILWEDFDRNKPAVKGGKTLEDFAAEFADKYQVSISGLRKNEADDYRYYLGTLWITREEKMFRTPFISNR